MNDTTSGVLVAFRDTKVWRIPAGARDLMSDDEKHRLDSFSREARKIEYLAAHTLARVCLEKMFVGTSQEWVISASGPVVVDGPQSVWVSLSHSDGWVASAVSTKGRVGIDIERPKSNTHWERVANKYFPSIEIDWLAKLDSASGRKAFYQLWTTKEAYLKALALNFHDGYRLLEQKGVACDPVDAKSQKPLKSWCINRGWHEKTFAFCVFAEHAESVKCINA